MEQLKHRARQSLGQGQTVEKPQKLSSSNHSAPLKNSSEAGGPDPVAWEGRLSVVLKACMSLV